MGRGWRGVGGRFRAQGLLCANDLHNAHKAGLTAAAVAVLSGGSNSSSCNSMQSCESQLSGAAAVARSGNRLAGARWLLPATPQQLGCNQVARTHQAASAVHLCSSSSIISRLHGPFARGLGWRAWVAFGSRVVVTRFASLSLFSRFCTPLFPPHKQQIGTQAPGRKGFLVWPPDQAPLWQGWQQGSDGSS